MKKESGGLPIPKFFPKFNRGITLELWRFGGTENFTRFKKSSLSKVKIAQMEIPFPAAFGREGCPRRKASRAGWVLIVERLNR